MNSYYYLCSYPLEPNSIVLPGNWGRILKKYICVNPNSIINLLREQTYEFIRYKEFSSLPSRLEAIFLCESIDGARVFRSNSSRTLDLIYEVELVDSSMPSHRTDWTLVNITQQETMTQVEDRARKYWSETPTSNIELLSLSKIRIIAQVTE